MDLVLKVYVGVLYASWRVPMLLGTQLPQGKFKGLAYEARLQRARAAGKRAVKEVFGA